MIWVCCIAYLRVPVLLRFCFGWIAVLTLGLLGVCFGVLVCSFGVFLLILVLMFVLLGLVALMILWRWFVDLLVGLCFWYVD